MGNGLLFFNRTDNCDRKPSTAHGTSSETTSHFIVAGMVRSNAEARDLRSGIWLLSSPLTRRRHFKRRRGGFLQNLLRSVAGRVRWSSGEGLRAYSDFQALVVVATFSTTFTNDHGTLCSLSQGIAAIGCYCTVIDVGIIPRAIR